MLFWGSRFFSFLSFCELLRILQGYLSSCLKLFRWIPFTHWNFSEGEWSVEFQGLLKVFWHLQSLRGLLHLWCWCWIDEMGWSLLLCVLLWGWVQVNLCISLVPYLCTGQRRSCQSVSRILLARLSLGEVKLKNSPCSLVLFFERGSYLRNVKGMCAFSFSWYLDYLLRQQTDLLQIAIKTIVCIVLNKPWQTVGPPSPLPLHLELGRVKAFAFE